MPDRKILEGCSVYEPVGPVSNAEPVRSCSSSLPATRGRFGVLNSFVDVTMRSLRGAALEVWLVLFRDVRDGVATTSHSRIATRTGRSRRTVIRAIKKLEAAGLVDVIHRGGLNAGTNHYRVNALAVRRDK